MQREYNSIQDYLQNDVILEWKALEYAHYEKEKKWYLTAGLILSAIIIYALISDNPMMAITFILIGAVGYIHLEKPPRNLSFRITHDGVLAGNELFDFENIKSFWIYYEPEYQAISLHTDSALLPFIHISIQDQDPVLIREILIHFVPEAKHQPGMVEHIERIFKI